MSRARCTMREHAEMYMIGCRERVGARSFHVSVGWCAHARAHSCLAYGRTHSAHMYGKLVSLYMHDASCGHPNGECGDVHTLYTCWQ